MYTSDNKTASTTQKSTEILTKLFSWPDTGNHFIVIARGLLDVSEFEAIFREVAETTESLLSCKVLIDLQEATYKLEAPTLEAFVNGLRFDFWPQSTKAAFVPARDASLRNQLLVLSNNLSNRGLKVAVFYNSKDAVIWLAEGA